MREFDKIWIEQCEAARDIHQLPPGSGGPSGVHRGDPRFAAEIVDILDRAEIRTYLDTVRRVGPLGHTATDEEYDELREAGAVPESPVRWAQAILLIERAKEVRIARGLL